MASNNEWAPLVPPSKRSNGNKRNSKEYQQMILNQVNEMFDSILDPDIILSVVQNCKWQLQPSIDGLITLSANIDNSVSQKNQQSNEQNLVSSKKVVFKQNELTSVKIQNVEKLPQRADKDEDASFLDMNESELQRQQEEFRKFERLRSNLIQKEVNSSHENMSEFSNLTANKISSEKLQPFGQSWCNSLGLSEADGASKGPTLQKNVTQDLPSRQSNRNQKTFKQPVESSVLSEFNQFSGEMPDKLYGKGTIPKTPQFLYKSPMELSSLQNDFQRFVGDVPCQQKSPARSRPSSGGVPNFPNLPKNFQNHGQAAALPPRNYSNQRNPNVYNETTTKGYPIGSDPAGQSFDRYSSKQEVALFNSSTNPHKMETESLCGLKVQYRIPGLENSSDDDADVIIEEETTDYNVQIPPLAPSAGESPYFSLLHRGPAKNAYPEIRPIFSNLPYGTPQFAQEQPANRTRNSYDTVLHKIKTAIRQGNKIMILLRGIPGSGKSYLARSIVHSTVNDNPALYIFSADDYFLTLGHGVFKYDRSKLEEAHSITQRKTWKALKEGRSPVIVDNTNCQYWEMQPYATMAVQHGYIVEILEPNTPWSQNTNELAKKNVHGVPKAKIKQMMERYDKNISGSKLLQKLSLRYAPTNMPPQPRKIPPLDAKKDNQDVTVETEKQKTKRNRRRRKNASQNTEDTDSVQNDGVSEYFRDNFGEKTSSLENLLDISKLKDNLDDDVSTESTSDYAALRKLGEANVEMDLDNDDIDADLRRSADKDFEENTYSLEERNEANVSAVIDGNGSDYQSESSVSKIDTIENSEDASNAFQPNLGAIGSERIGSLSDIVFHSANKSDQDNNENVMSQCWDFTLLLNGSQIHSVAPPDKSVKQDVTNEETYDFSNEASCYNQDIDTDITYELKDIANVIAPLDMESLIDEKVASINYLESCDEKSNDTQNTMKSNDSNRSPNRDTIALKGFVASKSINEESSSKCIKANSRVTNKMDELVIENDISIDTFADFLLQSVTHDDLAEDSRNRKDINASAAKALDENSDKDLDCGSSSQPFHKKIFNIGFMFSAATKSLLGSQKSAVPADVGEAAVKQTESNDKASPSCPPSDSESDQLKPVEQSAIARDTLSRKLSNAACINNNIDKTNAIKDSACLISSPIICDTFTADEDDVFIDDTLSKKLSSSAVEGNAVLGENIYTADVSNNCEFVERNNDRDIENLIEIYECSDKQTNTVEGKTDLHSSISKFSLQDTALLQSSSSVLNTQIDDDIDDLSNTASSDTVRDEYVIVERDQDREFNQATSISNNTINEETDDCEKDLIVAPNSNDDTLESSLGNIPQISTNPIDDFRNSIYEGSINEILSTSEIKSEETTYNLEDIKTVLTESSENIEISIEKKSKVRNYIEAGTSKRDSGEIKNEADKSKLNDDTLNLAAEKLRSIVNSNAKLEISAKDDEVDESSDLIDSERNITQANILNTVHDSSSTIDIEENTGSKEKAELSLGDNETVNVMQEAAKVELSQDLDTSGTSDNMSQKKGLVSAVANEEVIDATKELYVELASLKTEAYELCRQFIEIAKLKSISNEELGVEDSNSNTSVRDCQDDVATDECELSTERTDTDKTLETRESDSNVENEKSNDIIDNINRITWKESPFPIDEIPNSTHKEENRAIATSNSSTNTSYYDFNVSYVGGTSEPEYKMLDTFNRSINEGTLFVRTEKPPLKLMLDKSSMTNEIDSLIVEQNPSDEAEDNKEHCVRELMEMFPHVPKEYIMEIYENYNSDFNWAVDVLLEGIPDYEIKYSKLETLSLVPENDSARRKKIDASKQRSSSSESNDSEPSSHSQNIKPKRKKHKYNISEANMELKKQIEEKLKINEASYHPHILRVKRWKNGEPDISPDEIIESQASTRDRIEFVQSISQRGESDVQESGAQNEDEIAQANQMENVDDSVTDDDAEPEETIELNLGHDFIESLENEFGNPGFQLPHGLLPAIHIKRSMAQELHALWIDSMQRQLDAQQEQLDAMIAKDAELARSLEQEEAKAITESDVPNLHEMMDMEMALAIYNNEMKEQMKRETPNDMASRLTRQMLHNTFPEYNRETLNEILKAHDGNFKETVEVLEASTGKSPDRNNALKMQKNLMDKLKQESDNPVQTSSASTQPLIVVNTDLHYSNKSQRLTYDNAVEEAQESRKEAQRQFERRNENFNKAAEAHRKGNAEIAVYYSQMAKLHSKKMEMANSIAASAFLAAQAYMADEDNTLDLHNLFVPEAMEALDVFLDYQLRKLNQENRKSTNLYVITGRGARSNNGLSKIKPAVARKLAARNIRFTDANPGCLKIFLHRNNKVTN